MASKLRSLLSHKVCDALRKAGASSLDNDALARVLQPAIRVFPKPSNTQGLDYRLSINILHSLLSGHSPDQSAAESLGSSVVQQLTTDSTLRSVAVTQRDKDVDLSLTVHSPALVSQLLQETVKSPTSFWQHSPLLATLPHQRVVVEYSSPNIAKPFHMGHLRSTIIGHSLSRLHEALGHTVTRINFLGDWGTQFGMLKYGYDTKGLQRSDLSSDAIRKLNEVYVWSNAQAVDDPTVAEKAKLIFASMEAGDVSQLDTWQLFRDLSVKDLQIMYGRLGITFDEYHGESMYRAKKSEDVIKTMEEKGLLHHIEDGRKMFEVSPGKFVTVVKSDGSSIYLSRDIAAALDRHDKYQFDRHYYVVDSSQMEHFRAVFSALRQLGHDWVTGMRHIRFGRITGLSSRKGNAALLTDILDDGKAVMKERQQETDTSLVSGDESELAADTVALSSLVFEDLMKRRHRDYNFDWRRALQSKSSVQYAHCRLVQLEKTCGVEFCPDTDATPLLRDVSALTLISHIARFDEILYRYYENLEPNVLVKYLYSLSSSINSANKKLRVRGAAPADAEARLMLFVAARHTLAAGMTVMGITPLNRM